VGGDRRDGGVGDGHDAPFPGTGLWMFGDVVLSSN